jgi:RimJ/RimL family protein N-acetyltransferase
MILEAGAVALVPLAIDHVDALWAAASGPRDSYRFSTVPASREAMRAYVEEALAGAFVPYATTWRGRVVGSTRFLPERWHRGDTIHACEIGWTWLAADAQRTEVNTTAKLLMLGHAFERWRVHRVHLKTDARNARSRAAIERLGARLDGILRAHMPAADGGVRDSAWYSIVAAEWPAIRDRLQKT